MKIKDIIFIIIIGILILTLFNKSTKKEFIETVKIDTIFHIDTIIKYKPKYDTIYLSKYITDTLKLKGDTIYKEVEIPITTKVYKDSLYEAKISGFKAELDYLKVYPRETTIYKEKLVKSPKNRLNWGVQLGCGYGIFNKKPDIYLGLGLQYNF